MKAKQIVIVVVLLVLTTGVVYFVANRPEKGSSYQDLVARADEPLVLDPKYKLAVYSVTDEAGCTDCKKMGDYAQEMLNKKFTEMMSNGKVEFHKVQLGDPASSGIITELNLQKKGIVLVRTGGGESAKIRKLDSASDYASSQEALNLYLTREIKSILKSS